MTNLVALRTLPRQRDWLIAASASCWGGERGWRPSQARSWSAVIAAVYLSSGLRACLTCGGR